MDLKLKTGLNFRDDLFYTCEKQYFDVVSQVHSVVVTKRGFWILRVWRPFEFGPKNRSKDGETLFRVSADWFGKYIVAPDAKIGKTVENIGKNVCLMEIELYDEEHQKVVEKLKPGDFVVITNVHFAFNKGFTYLRLHSGISHGRGILKVEPEYKNEQFQELRKKCAEMLEKTTDFENFVEFVEIPAPIEVAAPEKMVKNCRKILVGDKIAVDWFGHREAREFHFLTHAHSDHLTGLDAKWTRPVYCSQRTARILPLILGFEFPAGVLCPLAENVTHKFENAHFSVTLLDANHCPGAVMFVFEGPEIGKVLCTGDFRADSILMEKLKEDGEFHWIKEKVFSKIYLDVTYFSQDQVFPERAEAVEKLCNSIKSLDPDTDVYIPLHRLGREELLEELQSKIEEPLEIYEEKLKICRELGHFEREKFEKTGRDIRVVKRNRWQLENDGNEKEKKKFVIYDVTMLGLITPSDAMIRKFQKNVIEIPYSDHSSRSEILQFLDSLKFESIEICSKSVSQQDFDLLMKNSVLQEQQDELMEETPDIEQESENQYQYRGANLDKWKEGPPKSLDEFFQRIPDIIEQ